MVAQSATTAPNALTLQAELHDGQRLYRLAGDGPAAQLHVEAWAMREAVSQLSELRLVCLSLDATLALKDMIGQRLTLQTVLADGTLHPRSGMVRTAELLGAEGGLARYRLTVVPWLWLATQQARSQVFQNRPVRDIIEQVLEPYAQHGTWRYADDVAEFLSAAPSRVYCTQYRETDHAFLRRLLDEEGLGWRLEEDEQTPNSQRLVIFADSARQDASPASPARFHRQGAQEQSDAVQALVRRTRQSVAQVGLAAWNPDGKTLLEGTAPAAHAVGGPRSPRVEYDEVLGLDDQSRGWQDTRTIERYARLLMEAAEARADVLLGRGTVRNLASGTLLEIDEAPALGLAGAPRLLLDAIEHVGINNLPVETAKAIESAVGGPTRHLVFDEQRLPVTDEPDIFGLLPALAPRREDVAADAATLAAAKQTGYANHFRGVHADRPWRAAIAAAQGTRLHARPVAQGVHSAIVVGPQGERSASGADELYCNARGDVRVRFHWQDDDGRPDNRSTRWVRVAQRQAGAGMGWQWLPRIGQEVLVKFTDGDPDQPIVVGALYNGRGAGGIAPTPGGAGSDANTDNDVFTQANDGKTSAQANLAAGQGGGHAPAWHGASADAAGHRNTAALWGFKTKEFGGTGSSHLVFDDTKQQLRVQLHTSTAHTQLNLGHLIHQQDNYRGSFRGQGFELRTDGYAALRGGRGVLLSTYHDDAGTAGTTDRKLEPSGDLAGGMALARQLSELSRTMSDAAATHQSVLLASHTGAEKADASSLEAEHAPNAALLRTVSTTVDGASLDTALQDAAARNDSTGEDKVPHTADAVVALAARGGLVAVAGQHLQLAAGETATLASGDAINLSTAETLRIHSGQAFGLLGAAANADHNSEGLSLIAAENAIEVQAQHDTLKLQSRDTLSLASVTQNLDLASAKKVRIATAQGASVVLEGGNITFECPGTITYHAAQRSLQGPTQGSYDLPAFPRSTIAPEKLDFKITLQDIAGFAGVAMLARKWSIVQIDPQVASLADEGTAAFYRQDPQYHVQTFASGESSGTGEVELDEETKKTVWQAMQRSPGHVWLLHDSHSVPLNSVVKSQAAGTAVQEQVLGAHNYLASLANVGDNLRAELKGWAEYDFQTALLGKPKQDTEI